MRKLTLAFAVVMITGAFETKSVVVAKPVVTVETVVSRLDSLTSAIKKKNLNHIKSGNDAQ